MFDYLLARGACHFLGNKPVKDDKKLSTGLTAILVEIRANITEIMGSNPVFHRSFTFSVFPFLAAHVTRKAAGIVNLIKVTVDLQGCLPKNHSHERVLCYNHCISAILVSVSYEELSNVYRFVFIGQLIRLVLKYGK